MLRDIAWERGWACLSILLGSGSDARIWPSKTRLVGLSAKKRISAEEG
jgi:hypothetical protein